MYVLIDIESFSRDSDGVFCIGVLTAKSINTDPKDCNISVFYLSPKSLTGGAWKFWNSDQTKIDFYKKCLNTAAVQDNKDTITQLREHIDSIYEESSSDPVFFSDFPTFDFGLVDTLLEKHQFLPIYLKSDESYPAPCVNYKNYIKGVARYPPWTDSDKSLKRLRVELPERAKDHDVEKDLRIMWEEIRLIMDASSKLCEDKDIE